MNIGVLAKINSSHNNLRTTSMQGIFSEFPDIGETFLIQGEGIDFGNRMIHTTPVKEILEIGKDEDDLDYLIFETENSTYRLTLLEEITEKESENYMSDSFKMPESPSSVN